MDRLDPALILARYHARHAVKHLACPVCMRPAPARPSHRAGGTSRLAIRRSPVPPRPLPVG